MALGAALARLRPWAAARRARRRYTSVILSNVYPDASASAACVRTASLARGLARLPASAPEPGAADGGAGDGGLRPPTASGEHESARPAPAHNVVYYATSVDIAGSQRRPNPLDCRSGAIQLLHLPPNRTDLMEKHFPTNETEDSPSPERDKSGGPEVDLVVFDRFFAEEAHSFRFRRRFPRAALVLDLQDLHALRWGRQRIVEAWDAERTRDAPERDPFGCVPRVMDYLPAAGEEGERFLRELASVHRSDLVLVCSPRELHWLRSVYGVPAEKLCLASFFVDEKARGDRPLPLPPHPSGDGSPPPRFVFCGGFKHSPNVDAVRVLIDHVWPRLQARLPDATLHIYGAFCPDRLRAEHRRSRTVHVHGHEPDLAAIFGTDGGVLLAPLRFGAGIKGKIVDAWTFGMPVVTTPVGSEGMTLDGDARFGGRIAATLEGFVEAAVDLAARPAAYRRAQADGDFLVRELFSASRNWDYVQRRLSTVLDETALARRRRDDTTQAMLWHQSLRSTEYFSRWIELKERKLADERTRDAS